MSPRLISRRNEIRLGLIPWEEAERRREVDRARIYDDMYPEAVEAAAAVAAKGIAGLRP